MNKSCCLTIGCILLIIWIIVFCRISNAAIEEFGNDKVEYLVVVMTNKNTSKYLGDRGLLVDSAENAAKVSLVGDIKNMYIKKAKLSGVSYLGKTLSTVVWKRKGIKLQLVPTYNKHDNNLTNKHMGVYNIKLVDGNKYIATNDIKLAFTDKQEKAASIHFWRLT